MAFGAENRSWWTASFWVTAVMLISMFCVGSGHAENNQIEINGDETVTMMVEGSEITLHPRFEINRVVAANEYRNRNEQTQRWSEDAEEQIDSMYDPVKRDFTELSTDRVERRYDADTNEVVLVFEWGQVEIRPAETEKGLTIEVEVKNETEKVIEDIEATLYEVDVPAGVKIQNPRSASGCNLGGPTLRRALFGDTQLLWVSSQPNRPMRQTLKKVDDQRLQLRFQAGSPDGGKEIFDGVWDVRPIRGGESDKYEFGVRLGESDENPYNVASDVYEAFGEAYPSTLDWPDRRPIGAVHVADSRTSEENPRGWRHGFSIPNDWDIAEDEGYEEFYEGVMRGADKIIRASRREGVQGIIVWQIEGMEFPGPAYYGEPRHLKYHAPEIDKAADDFFARIREAGFRVGITIRPTIHFPRSKETKKLVPWDDMTDLWGRNWVKRIPDSCRNLYDEEETWNVTKRLSNKIQYAKDRWGATLFYVDTNSFWRPRTPGQEDWGWESKRLSASVFRDLLEEHPDVLIIPEHQYFQYWAYSAQYRQPPRWGSPTRYDVRLAYPEAFSVIAGTHHEEKPDRYIRAIVRGDTFFGHGWRAGPAEMLDLVYHPAAALAPFHVHVFDEGVELNDERCVDIEELKKILSQKLSPSSPVRKRRVFVTYADNCSVERREAVYDAIGDVGGILAWSQPEAPEWSGFWTPDSPLNAVTEDAAAYLLSVSSGDEEGVAAVVVNASEEKRVVKVEIEYEDLGIGVAGPRDIHIQNVKNLQKELSDAPEGSPEDALNGTESADGEVGDLLEEIEADAEVMDKDREEFEFSDENYWLDEDGIELLVPAGAYRVLHIRGR